MEPQNDGAREAGLEEERLAELSSAVGEAVGFFVFGKREKKDGVFVEDDTSMAVSPDLLGISEESFDTLPEEDRAAVEEGIFAELDITREELPNLIVANHTLSDGIIETVYMIKDGFAKFLHLVQQFDDDKEVRRLWTICPNEEPGGFLDDYEFN
jgi:hypothetical protein